MVPAMPAPKSIDASFEYHLGTPQANAHTIAPHRKMNEMQCLCISLSKLAKSQECALYPT